MSEADIITIVSIVLYSLPTVFQLTKYIGQKTHNQIIVNLSNRALIIVKALEQDAALTNDQRKEQALNSLSDWASEVGVHLSSQQMSDYIEAAIKTMKNQDSQASTKELKDQVKVLKDTLATTETTIAAATTEAAKVTTKATTEDSNPRVN